MSAGLHYSDTLNGRVFSQTNQIASVAGLAIPIFSATAVAGGLPLWNPPGSNRNVELISLDINYMSGTAALTSLGIMAMPLGTTGTGTGCSVFTSAAPMNGSLLGGNASKILSAAGGTVTVTAGIATYPVPGIVGAGWTRSLASINLEAATGTAQGTRVDRYNFDGTLNLPQGVMIYLAGGLASVALYNLTWTWAEYIINPAQG